MKVKLLVSRAGPGGAHAPGDVIEVSKAEAKRMMEADPPQAVPVREDPSTEHAARESKPKAGDDLELTPPAKSERTGKD